MIFGYMTMTWIECKCEFCHESNHVQQPQCDLSMQVHQVYILIAVIDLPRRGPIGRVLKACSRFGVWRLSEAPEHTTKEQADLKTPRTCAETPHSASPGDYVS
jgi:hypothetical protein